MDKPKTKDLTSKQFWPKYSPFIQPYPTHNTQASHSSDSLWPSHWSWKHPAVNFFRSQSSAQPITSQSCQRLHSSVIFGSWKFQEGNQGNREKNQQDTTEHRLSVNPQGPPANVWHPFQLLVGAQGGYLAAAKQKIIKKKKQCKQKDNHTYIWASHGTKSV